MRRIARAALLVTAILAFAMPLESSPVPPGWAVVPPHWLDGLPGDEVYVAPDPIMLTELGESLQTPVEGDLLTVGTRVKRRLERDDAIEVRTLQVETSEGSVTVSGIVSTEPQKERAIEAARDASGDVAVESEIDVEGDRD